MISAMVQTDNHIDSISLPAKQLRALLDDLDNAATPTGQKKDYRYHRRLKYRTPRVVVRVLDSRGREETFFEASTRNISSRGLAFLHKQMLVPGQQLILSIPVLDEQTIYVTASVAHCRHLKGMVHEIGATFLNFIENPD